MTTKAAPSGACVRAGIARGSSASRRHALGLAIFAAFFTLALAATLPAYIDEAYTFHLATDPSLPHVLAALRAGADGTFPLFGTLAFAWDKLFGSSEMSLRMTSGIFVVLLVMHGGGRLRRIFPPMPVTLALLTILANHRWIHGAVQARGYGLLVLAFSLAFWSTWDLIENQSPLARSRWLLHAIGAGLLWLSHPLGMLYGGILAALYVAFSLRLKSFSLIKLAAFAGGPILFLAWLPSFLIQQTIRPVFPPGFSLPGWRKYWDYAFLESPVFLGLLLLGSVLLLLPRQPAPEADRPSATRRGLVLYALSSIVLLNAAVAVLDAAGFIDIYVMMAVRYVLVAIVPFAVLFAATFDAMESWMRALGRHRALRAVQALIAMLLLVQMQRTWSAGRAEKLAREPALHAVARMARERGLDVLCAGHVDAFFLETRAGLPQVSYLMEEDFAFRTLMLRHHQFYPQPRPITAADAQRHPKSWLFVPPTGDAFVLEAPKAR